MYDADGTQRSLASPPDLSEESVSSALAAAQQAEQKSGTLSAGDRRFLYGRRTLSSGMLKVVLVDLTQQDTSIRNALLILLGTGAAGLTLLWFVSRFVAKRAVLPVEEAFSKQENFVADASHELKTPLAIVTATLSAVIRDYTPSGQAGLFQGVRMIFAVLLPMLIGPFIGAAVIRNSGVTYLELGVVKNVPTPAIFLAAAAVLLLTAIPVTLLKRRTKA